MANSILDINEILNDYSLDIQEAITHKANLIADLGANKLKSNSPKRTGKYAKSWKVKQVSGRGYVHNTIYNTRYQLTHLLEKGHVKRNGGFVPPKVHIAPVESIINRDFEKSVENIIKNGG